MDINVPKIREELQEMVGPKEKVNLHLDKRMKPRISVAEREVHGEFTFHCRLNPHLIRSPQQLDRAVQYLHRSVLLSYGEAG